LSGGENVADDESNLRRIGVTAAALLLALIAAGCGGSEDPLAHSCKASDQRFIQTASLNLTALGALAADYQQGQAEADEVVGEASDAALRVTHVKPNDPSLQQAQRYLDAMFNEYAAAVKLHGEGKDAGARMYRAYGLANFAHDVLAEAQPELLRQGCDVAPLL
jgi:hypothetical protein